jgi:hypothetical protein
MNIIFAHNSKQHSECSHWIVEVNRISIVLELKYSIHNLWIRTGENIHLLETEIQK